MAEAGLSPWVVLAVLAALAVAAALAHRSAGAVGFAVGVGVGAFGFLVTLWMLFLQIGS